MTTTYLPPKEYSQLAFLQFDDASSRTASIATHAVRAPDETKLEREYRIERKIRTLEMLFGLLSDMTPDQKRLFNEAVRHRPLFGPESP